MEEEKRNCEYYKDVPCLWYGKIPCSRCPTRVTRSIKERAEESKETFEPDSIGGLDMSEYPINIDIANTDICALCSRAVDKWGREAQMMMVIEECAELLDVVAKSYRGRVSNEDILSEVVDVELMLNQLRYMVGDENAYFRIRKEKIKRLEKKLEEE